MRRKLAHTLGIGALALSIVAAMSATPVLAGDSPGIEGFIPPAAGNEVGTAHPGDCFWAQEQSISTGKIIKKSKAIVTNKVIEAVDPNHYLWNVVDLPPTADIPNCGPGATKLVP